VNNAFFGDFRDVGKFQRISSDARASDHATNLRGRRGVLTLATVAATQSAVWHAAGLAEL
jgi:hypothetical protein